jgi:hypothetical protein
MSTRRPLYVHHRSCSGRGTSLCARRCSSNRLRNGASNRVGSPPTFRTRTRRTRRFPDMSYDHDPQGWQDGGRPGSRPTWSARRRLRSPRSHGRSGSSRWATGPWPSGTSPTAAPRCAVCERQLRRRCRAAVGVGPKELHRILRFHGFVARVRASIDRPGAPDRTNGALSQRLWPEVPFAQPDDLGMEVLALTRTPIEPPELGKRASRTVSSLTARRDPPGTSHRSQRSTRGSHDGCS